MKIIHEYPVKIFKNEALGYTFYRMGLSKKDQNGKYMNGSIDVHFRKDVEIDVDKKIYIQDAWLDFYVKNKVTHIYIFINKFEYVSDVIKDEKIETDPFEEFGNEVELTDDDLPF